MIHAESARRGLECFMVNNLTRNTEEQCKFVIDNDCLEDEATIDYARLVFCDISLEMRWAAIILVLFLVLIMFLNLSAVADEFLCPNLLTVARNLRMSDSLAGVTLLAFGNGCPDIFSSLAAASSGRPEIIVGELLGAGIFCTSIVAGLIFIHNDFKLARKPLLRDTAFYLLAVFLMWLFCFQRAVTFYGSLAFIIIYVIYLFFALSGEAIHSRLRGEYPIAEAIEKYHEKESGDFQERVSQQEELEFWFRWREESLRRGSLVKWCECCCKNGKNTLVLSDNSTTMRISYLNPNERPIVGSVDSMSVSKLNAAACWSSGDASLESRSKSQGPDFQSTSQPPLNEANLVLKNDTKLTLNELWESLEHISPITSDEWRQVSLIGKIILILRSPLLLLTTLTVPVVNNDGKNKNWNRLLNSIHCITMPMAVMLLLKIGLSDEDDFDDDDTNEVRLRRVDWSAVRAVDIGAEVQQSDSYWSHLSTLVPLRYWLITPSFALALFVLCSTSNHKAPKYHALFSYFGFAMSVMWIYKLATEIISILKIVGIIFSMTDTAIGLGVLAWGNSLGDIVANLSLAETGYARMALGASIGAPLLNLLLGFGLSFCVSLKPGESIHIEYTQTTALLAITLASVLVLLMLSTLAPGNKSKKPFGYLLISCYGIYFALAVCLECKLIKF